MTGKKKVLLIHRYFWPDTPPYAVMLKEMAEGLSNEGYDVTVFSSQPSYKLDLSIPKQPYKEEMGKFKVVRNRMHISSRRNAVTRLVDILSFCLGLFFHLLKGKYDVCMMATTPPIIGGLTLRLGCKLKGIPYMYHCQDIYPEVALVSHSIPEGWLYKLLRSIDLKTCENALATIILSEDMKQSMIDRGYKSKHNLYIINNFELKGGKEAVNALPSMDNGFFNVVFAGNIGRFQGLKTVTDAINQLESQQHIRFHFVGEGAALKETKEAVASLIGKTTFFLGHQPVSVTRAFLKEASLCLVTLQKDIVRYAFPSKTMTYLCEGRPLLVMVEKDSALAQMVVRENIGFVVAPANSSEMAATILEASLNLEENKKQAENAKHFAVNNFSSHFVVSKWLKLFNEKFKEVECVK